LVINGTSSAFLCARVCHDDPYLARILHELHTPSLVS
jgi:hypothetical protein